MMTKLDGCECVTQSMGVNVLLEMEDVAIVAIGSLACLRGLSTFIGHRNIFMIPIAKLDVVMSKQLQRCEESIVYIYQNFGYTKFVLYLTCVDLVLAVPYDSIFSSLKQKYGIEVSVFKRGPLSKDLDSMEKQIDDIMAKWR